MGVLLPALFINLRPFVPWLFGTMTFAGALNLRARELGKAASTPVPLLLFFTTAHIILPLAALVLSRLIFSSEPDTVSGYVLLYAAPTAVTGFIWTSIFRGDPALSLTLILLDSLAAPFVVPGTVRLLLGTNVSLNMTGMVISLIYMLLVPTIVGVGLNEFSSGKIPARISPYMRPLSKICMILVIAANSSAVAPQVRFDSLRVWIIILVCVTFSTLGLLCGKLAGLVGKFDRKRQISLFFASGLRNTSAAMTLAIDFFPAGAALPAMFGIMFQQATATVMSRLLIGKIDDRAGD